MDSDGLFILKGAKYIGAGLATIGVIGSGVGIGIIFSGYMISLSRNPFQQPELIRFTFLGFALSEAMGLLAIMMAFLILYG
jgi:F-type H+-transporting ATPase subunit c